MSEVQLTLPLILDREDKSSPFKNCIRNNYQHLKKWAKRTQTECFRIYNRELHHYPITVDIYAGRFCINYYKKAAENFEPPKPLVAEVENTLFSLFGTKTHSIYWKTRFRRKKTQQYDKVDRRKNFFVVYENGLKFLINLTDYLDTGLFLDHRETRKLVMASSKDKKVLNLFSYTCSFSVYAAAGGAVSTKSVDLSNTYTAWGKKNFQLNSLSLKKNQIIRDDCMKFFEKEIRLQAKYDLIIIDPPTISRSKKMEYMFDIQKEHSKLLLNAKKLLSKEGIIFFSTNSRRFTLDTSLTEFFSVEEISHRTVPKEFQQSKTHRCWRLKT